MNIIERIKIFATNPKVQRVVHNFSLIALTLGSLCWVLWFFQKHKMGYGDATLVFFGIWFIVGLAIRQMMENKNCSPRLYLHTILNFMGVLMLLMAVTPGDFFVTNLVILGFTFLIALKLL